jgi:hypothetical protein
MNKPPVKNIKVSRKALLVVAAIVVAIVLVGAGVLIGRETEHEGLTATDKKQSAPPMADLRTAMTVAAVQHGDLLNRAVNAKIDGSKDADALKQALDSDTENVSAPFSGYYGSATTASVNKAYKAYHEGAFAYAEAAKRGDTTEQQNIVTKLNADYSSVITDAIAKINPKTDKLLVKSGFAITVSNTAEMINAHVKGDTAQETNQVHSLGLQFKSLYEVITQNMIDQVISSGPIVI